MKKIETKHKRQKVIKITKFEKSKRGKIKRGFENGQKTKIKKGEIEGRRKLQIKKMENVEMSNK